MVAAVVLAAATGVATFARRSVVLRSEDWLVDSLCDVDSLADAELAVEAERDSLARSDAAAAESLIDSDVDAD